MRSYVVSGYGEVRDAIARDWYAFFAKAMPGVSWMLLPNLGRDIADYIAKWRIDGFVLSGGNDIGEDPVRDLTEDTILDMASESALPVLGVCRGLQMIQRHFGGSIARRQDNNHVGKRHIVRVTANPWLKVPGDSVEVNSFHNMGVPADGIAAPLKLIAASDDGSVEGLCHAGLPIVAIQWHPEREQNVNQADRDLFANVLGLTERK